MITLNNYTEVYDFLLSKDTLLLEKEYCNKMTKMKMLCLKCGDIFYKTLSHFQAGRTCSKCKKEARQNKQFYYIKQYVAQYGYILLSTECVNAHENLYMMCSKGHLSIVSWNNFKSGKRCKQCGYDANKHSYKYVKDYIGKYGCTLLSTQYINVRNKLKIQCEKGHIFYMTFNNFRQGNRCGLCSHSIGEDEVLRVLRKYNIINFSQYIFEDCKFYNSLPFDFYIPSKRTIIEYDGKQHYDIINFFGGLEGFIDRKIRDTVKNIYCKDNDIQLIRIPYFRFNDIEQILIQKLKLNDK